MHVCDDIFHAFFCVVSRLWGLCKAGGRNNTQVGTQQGEVVDSGQTLKLITWTQESTLGALKKINDKFFEETGMLYLQQIR